MPSFLDRLRGRSADTDDRPLSPLPSPSRPATDPAAPPRRPRADERARLRRRLKRTGELRAALLLELGALVYEMHRQGRGEHRGLLERKTAELRAVDGEARALAQALDAEATLAELVSDGVLGVCRCGALLAADASFCSACGAPAIPVAPAEEEPIGSALGPGEGAEAGSRVGDPTRGARERPAPAPIAGADARSSWEAPWSAGDRPPEESARQGPPPPPPPGSARRWPREQRSPR